MTDKPTTNPKGETLHVPWRNAAVFLREAAKVLKSQGYTAYPEYEGETGYSAGMVLCLVTGCRISPDQQRRWEHHTVICDEVRRRFCGYLYLTGDLISAPHNVSMSEEIEWWERNPPHLDRDRIVAALSASAAILEEHIDMYAKITPPAPRTI